MKLLISPQNTKEAIEAIAGGANIIDVKNPKEGSLGANFPWVIKEIKQLIPDNVELSCTLGEAPNLPGSITLAAYGAASLEVNYVKVGLSGVQTVQKTVNLLENIVHATKMCNSKIKVVAAGYGDYFRAGSIEPQLVVQAAFTAKADIVMLDTAIKDGKNIFNHQTPQQLEEFIDTAHKHNLGVALAGSLQAQDLPVVKKLGADFVGLRGAACQNNNRDTGHITRERVKKLSEIIKQT
ncbi:MAG: (5-formylfuran-3-yl)methyl phosphate synthase [Nitrososphaerota archaeon]|nr:(5-formylfuran-3-yl)methyl phosphate synthase [Nitrososphaerota archaeon]